jgi:uncharacterized protein
MSSAPLTHPPGGGRSDVPSELVWEQQRRAALWPYAELDVAGLRSQGWRPTPFRELVLKVHQRCNLACDYCYVYTQADQSWRDRPAAMPEDVWRAAVAALARHVRRHELTNVRVILHGGEPLLYGAERLGDLARHLRAGMPQQCTVDIGLQTNGVLLDQERMAALRRYGIAVGVSLDGPPAEHDRHRPTRGGRQSFAAVRAGLEVLRRPENLSSYAGILCLVAPDTDPIRCYEQLIDFAPPMIDFLLPHANWRQPPWRKTGSPTPYADWLIAIFDRWYDGVETRIRLFEDVIGLLIGDASRSEQIGLSAAASIVVESDGAIEQVDALKTAYAGACATGLDIRHDELDAALADPGIVARQLGWGALSVQCRQCEVAEVCGAGHYAHRYDPRNGFRNPSVYCADMFKLIQHVRARVETQVQRATRRSP